MTKIDAGSARRTEMVQEAIARFRRAADHCADNVYIARATAIADALEVEFAATEPDIWKLAVTKLAEPLRVTRRVLNEVCGERQRQESKWGQQDHHPFTFLAVLGEEVGEANQAALKATSEGKEWSSYRAELVQVAAVAVAMIESLDRNSKPMPQGGDADAIPVGLPEHGPDASPDDAGGPQSAAAGAEPWPSEAQMSALCSTQNLDVDPVAVPCHEAYRMIRAWLATCPPSPAHRAALERAEKAERLLTDLAGDATYWQEDCHTFLCAGCQYDHPTRPENRTKDCGCPCHEARRAAGLPAEEEGGE